MTFLLLSSSAILSLHSFIVLPLSCSYLKYTLSSSSFVALCSFSIFSITLGRKCPAICLNLGNFSTIISLDLWSLSWRLSDKLAKSSSIESNLTSFLETSLLLVSFSFSSSCLTFNNSSKVPYFSNWTLRDLSLLLYVVTFSEEFLYAIK